MYDDESSSESEGGRVVLTAIQKRDNAQAAIRAVLKKNLANLETIDWNAVKKSFAELGQKLQEAKIPSRSCSTSVYFQRYLKSTNSIGAAIKAQRANEEIKLTKAQTKARKTMRLTLDKHDRKYATQLAAHVPPESEVEEPSEPEDSDTDTDEDTDKEDVKTPEKPEGAVDEGDEDDEEEWSEDFSSDDTDEDGEDGADEQKRVSKRDRFYWTKEYTLLRQQRKGGDQGEKRARSHHKKKVKVSEDEKKIEAGKKKVDAELSPEQVMAKLKELLMKRGKRGTDRKQYRKDLETLVTKAKDPAAVLKVNVALVTAYLELNLNKAEHMDIDIWKKCVDCLEKMNHILSVNTNLRLSEDEEIEEQFEEDEDVRNDLDKVLSGGSSSKRAKKQAAIDAREAEEKKNSHLTYVRGNFYSFLFRLHIEFTRSLQKIDYHTAEYVQRLRDEPLLSNLCSIASQYYKSIDKPVLQCSCVLIQLELVYYYPDAKCMWDGKSRAPKSKVIDMCLFLYAHGDPRQKTRALLLHVFFLASHDWFAKARDLLLMSHIQDKINECDVSTRSLFNRSMAQLGLCSFRTGHYRQALDCLSDLQDTKHVKELLSQGTRQIKMSNSNLSPAEQKAQQEQIKLEKKRQYPFHMHINLDMLESVHLIGGMFSELDNIALDRQVDNLTVGKQRQKDKFRRQYERHHRASFNAPPESTRDLIMHATDALKAGKWRATMKHLNALRMWMYVPNAAKVKANLAETVKQTALRMYLLIFGSSYISFSLQALVDQFELKKSVITRITSKMMVVGDLEAVWDQPSQTLTMNTALPTRLQKAALKYSNKIVQFVEDNDKLLSLGDRESRYSKGWDRNTRKNNSYTRSYGR
jgi:translation initiation factor 3 subunit C